MIYNRLPFLAVSTGNSTLIADFVQDTFYYLQPWTKIDDSVVEDENSYRGLKRILVAELTAYNILMRKVLINIAGENGSITSAAKHLKMGKADVVEAQFEYAKAGDGNELIMEAAKLVTEIKSGFCKYAVALGYYLPDCPYKMPVTLPGFIAFVDDDAT